MLIFWKKIFWTPPLIAKYTRLYLNFAWSKSFNQNIVINIHFSFLTCMYEKYKHQNEAFFLLSFWSKWVCMALTLSSSSIICDGMLFKWNFLQKLSSTNLLLWIFLTNFSSPNSMHVINNCYQDYCVKYHRSTSIYIMKVSAIQQKDYQHISEIIILNFLVGIHSNYKVITTKMFNK